MEIVDSAVSRNAARGGKEFAWQWAIALALFAIAMWFYTRHNDFSFSYHPDELSKVEQIHAGTRNFNHPLLLLTATDLLKRFARGDLDCQAIVQLGRLCSAFFAAAAVAIFSWLGFNRFGLRGGIAAGVLMLLQRRPYELAHFMKEDCALLAGIALTFLAMDAYWRRPVVLRAMFLGAAASLAASGKYVGIVMLLPALAVLISRRKSLSIGRGLSAFAAAFFVVLVLMNFPAVTAFPTVVSSVQREIGHLNARSDVSFHFSPFGWVRAFLEVSPFLLLFFIVHLVRSVRSFRSRSLPDLLLAGFPIGFGLLLSFSSKQGGRYALPMTELAALLGIIGALELWEYARAGRVRWMRNALMWTLICAGLYDLARTARLARGFQRDHRRELVEWIQQNVPVTATIAVDGRVGIPPERPAGQSTQFCEVPAIPQHVRSALFAADLGTVSEMRAAGVSYVAVAEGRYDVFFKKGRSARRGKEELFERRQTFYRQLFREGSLVWSRETGNVGTLNPGLRLYQISSSPAPSP